MWASPAKYGYKTEFVVPSAGVRKCATLKERDFGDCNNANSLEFPVGFGDGIGRTLFLRYY
jgi:hypothetical protein